MTLPQWWASGALREARALIWRHKRWLGAGLLFLVINRLAALILPGSSRYLLDSVLTGGRTELLSLIVVAIAGAALVQAATTFMLTKILEIGAQRAIADIRRRVNAHVLRLPVRFFDSTKSGGVMWRIMGDTEMVRDLIGTGLVHFGGATLTAVLALGYLFYLHAGLTLALLGVVVPLACGFALSFRRLRSLYETNAGIRAEIWGRLTESIGGIRVVKTYTAEKREERVFARGVHRLCRNLATSYFLRSSNAAMTALAIGAIGALVTLIGGRALVAQTLTVGEFLTYILFLAMVVGPCAHAVSLGPSVIEGLAALARIREVLNEPGEIDAEGNFAPLATVTGEVRFDDVSFEYEPGVPALQHVTLVAAAGTTVALVGASGAGKSTFLNLVMGFARPTTGRVLVDGRPLDTIRLRDYRSQLGVVLQDTILFDGTITENIRYGCPAASDERVRAASSIAHLAEFVRRLPRGYDTVVGERGVKLSGGQRQRVAIARAILADPRILILDEATSSLDSETEAAIQDGLRALRSGRTTFVIAHRLSTIRSADVIVVLEEGRIIGIGGHQRLLATNATYRRFYERQCGITPEQCATL